MSIDHKDIGHKLWESEWQTDGEPYGEPGEQQRNMQKVVYDSKDPNVRYTMSDYAKPDGQKDKYDIPSSVVEKERLGADGVWENVHVYSLEKDGSLKTWGKDAKGEWTPPGSDRPIVNANPPDDPVRGGAAPTPHATKSDHSTHQSGSNPPAPPTQHGPSRASDPLKQTRDGIIDGIDKIRHGIDKIGEIEDTFKKKMGMDWSVEKMVDKALGDLQTYAGHREPHGQINTGMPATVAQPSGGTPGDDVLTSSIGGINGLTNGFGWSEKPLVTADQSATTTQKNTTAGKPSPKSGLRLSV